MPLKFYLVFESKLNLFLYAAQDVCEIADKLEKIKELVSVQIGSPY